MRLFTACVLLLAALGLVPAAVPNAATAVPVLLEQSVTVVSPGGSEGSGVLFKNGKVTFVWTAAHVVADAEKVSRVAEVADGRERVAVRYQDVGVRRRVVEAGREVGHDFRLARVVRYSPGKRRGDDLALLRVHQASYGNASVKFLADGRLPRPGEPLWHVGSMGGTAAEQSLSDGVFAGAGRLRTNTRPDASGKVYDQVTLAALWGSSGGGVFLKSDGSCVGLLTEAAYGQSEVSNCVVPARRVREFARRTKCLWALDASVPVPAEDRVPVTDGPLPLPPPRGPGPEKNMPPAIQELLPLIGGYGR